MVTRLVPSAAKALVGEALVAYVLVVDDDAAIGRMISIVLGTEGLDCKVVTSGPDALQLLEPDPPALMILDLLLGGMTAEAIITAARAAGYAGPVLLCTAMGGELDIAADGIIRKPFEPEDLAARVKELTAEKA
jgi:DNA-binding response OmpR family regulator